MVHLEPSSRCQAACPMCARNLHGGRRRANLPLADTSLEALAEWLPGQFVRQLTAIVLCGNFGDPILAPDCLRIVEHLRRLNRRLFVGINTNGSARGRAFWQELGGLGVTVRFGIDGVSQESHERYRRHTDLARILRNAETFVDAGGRAVWDMLVFRHNEDEIETARALAKRLGFEKFVFKSTTRFGPDGRFPVRDREGAPIDELQVSERYSTAGSLRAPAEGALATCGISCKVQNQRSIYVDAGGLVLPCCWLAQLIHERPGVPDSKHDASWWTARVDSVLGLVDEVGAQRIDLHHCSLREIVEEVFPEISTRWAPGPQRLLQCAAICGNHGSDRIESTFVSEQAF